MAAYYDTKLKKYTVYDTETGIVLAYVEAQSRAEAIAKYRDGRNKK